MAELADRKALVDKFRDMASAEISRYESDRDDENDKRKIADYMYAAAQNRTIMQSEGVKGADRTYDPRSNVGSTIFFRQVNQMASQLNDVVTASRDLWKYVTIGSELVEGSLEDAKARAEQAMALSRWTRKRDSFDARFPEFATSLMKLSNVPVMIRQKRVVKKITEVTPIEEVVQDPETGELTTQIIDEQVSVQEAIVDNYPSIEFLHPERVYADPFIPNLENQNLVAVTSLRTIAEIYDDVKTGDFSQKAWKELSKNKQKYAWDGCSGYEGRDEERDNREETESPSGEGLFLQWDVLMRAPITPGGRWKDDNPPIIWVGKFIGNEVSSAICMQLIENDDPDGEMPLRMIHAVPDRFDSLYHTTHAEVIRSAYSVDCTLLNLAIDNISQINDPVLKIVDGQHSVSDFSVFHGQRWHVDNPDAISTFTIPDVTQGTIGIRNQVLELEQQALATDPAYVGQYAGARTSATEFMGVNQNSRQPHMSRIAYVLNQLLPWMARKQMSYWQAFGLPEQVVAITDEPKIYTIRPSQIAGDYDVIVDIVGQYQDDMMKQQGLMYFLQAAATNPALLQSSTHRTDMSKLLRQLYSKFGLNPDEFILPAGGQDARFRAAEENRVMLEAGQPTNPAQGEDHDIHIREHRAKLLEWEGIKPEEDERAINLDLIRSHINATLQMQQQEGMMAQGAPTQAPSGNESPGEVAGNAVAGAMGAVA